MSNKLKIFLSGGMTGLTEAEASYWRTSFKLNNAVQDDTPFIFIDPTYYYFTTDKTTQEYEKDGTAQEIMLAYTLNKPIIGMIEEDKYNQLHPWYKQECIKIFKYNSNELKETIEEIIKYIDRFNLKEEN